MKEAIKQMINIWAIYIKKNMYTHTYTKLQMRLRKRKQSLNEMN